MVVLFVSFAEEVKLRDFGKEGAGRATVPVKPVYLAQVTISAFV